MIGETKRRKLLHHSRTDLMCIPSEFTSAGSLHIARRSVIRKSSTYFRCTSALQPVAAPYAFLLLSAVKLCTSVSHVCLRLLLQATLACVCTWKSVLMISSNPSSIFGSRNLDAKPVNACFGRIARFSGFVLRKLSVSTSPSGLNPLVRSCVERTFGPRFSARTVSLCSQSRAGAVKRTHRTEIFSFCASSTQTARVSGSAFVLSDED
jgi:hypothetical protein